MKRFSIPNWLSWVLFLALMLFLFRTDAGKSIVGGAQALLLKTGVHNAPAEPLAEKVAPADDLLLRNADGKTIKLSDLRGKTVFLNQWATWCPPCRAEMPAIENLYQSADRSRIAFVMLSLDDSAEDAFAFAKEKGFTFPVYVPVGPLPAAFETSAIPTTFVLAPDGRIDQRIEGMANYDTDEFRKYLREVGSGK